MSYNPELVTFEFNATGKQSVYCMNHDLIELESELEKHLDYSTMKIIGFRGTIIATGKRIATGWHVCYH